MGAPETKIQKAPDGVTEYVRHFGGIQELLETAKGGAGVGRASRNETASEEWDFGVGFDGAVDLAEKGWHEGVAKIEALRQHITAPLIQSLEKTVEFSVAPGEWVDPDRFLSGQAEVFGGLVDTEVLARGSKGRAAHFLVGLACSGGIPASYIERRGAAIVAAADTLETLGFRVKITAYDSVGSLFERGIQHIDLIEIKDYHHPLDLDAVSFSLIHPAFQRRIVFGAQDANKHEIRKKFGFIADKGYGAYPFNRLPADFVEREEDSINFDGAQLDQFQDDSNATNAVKKILRKFGVELELNLKGEKT